MHVFVMHCMPATESHASIPWWIWSQPLTIRQARRKMHLKELQQDSLKQSNPLERNPLFLMFSVWLSQCMQALALFRLWLPGAPSKALQRCAILWSQILVKVLCFHPGSCLMEQIHHSFAMLLHVFTVNLDMLFFVSCSNMDICRICRICRTCRICRMDAWLRSLHWAFQIALSDAQQIPQQLCRLCKESPSIVLGCRVAWNKHEQISSKYINDYKIYTLWEFMRIVYKTIRFYKYLSNLQRQFLRGHSAKQRPGSVCHIKMKQSSWLQTKQFDFKLAIHGYSKILQGQVQGSLLPMALLSCEAVSIFHIIIYNYHIFLNLVSILLHTDSSDSVQSFPQFGVFEAPAKSPFAAAWAFCTCGLSPAAFSRVCRSLSQDVKTEFN